MEIQKYQTLKEVIPRGHHIFGCEHSFMFKKYFTPHKMKYKMHKHTKRHFRALIFLTPIKKT